jgi:hypothetical protein
MPAPIGGRNRERGRSMVHGELRRHLLQLILRCRGLCRLGRRNISPLRRRANVGDYVSDCTPTTETNLLRTPIESS